MWYVQFRSSWHARALTLKLAGQRHKLTSQCLAQRGAPLLTHLSFFDYRATPYAADSPAHSSHSARCPSEGWVSLRLAAHCGEDKCFNTGSRCVALSPRGLWQSLMLPLSSSSHGANLSGSTCAHSDTKFRATGRTRGPLLPAKGLGATQPSRPTQD